ncbi:alpha/beta fold hydrolase [Alcanivorax sediminis]|uniref:Alpha/beta fold hydrolase n=1 Tax=Alcanivorax sediminis TaxID=2663008 RepID=A0A6N7LX35_9GAMM|nr:alpha/beta hydrolase [Alcanivorax sediminis]MQX53784.1 alpha/beta fold hydrolase [Alcanivorax sediminis]
MSAVTDEKPVLAFAHANGIPGHSYDTFLAPLEDCYQLFIIDRLGHDPAYPVDAQWHSLSLELEARLAPLPKPIVGMGHSLGSVLMYLVAQRHPEWFSCLLMLDPPMMNGLHGVMMNVAKLTGQIDKATPAGKSKGRLDYWPDWAAVESYFGSRRLFRAFDPRCLQDYMRAGVEQWEGGWRLRFRPEVEVAIFRETPTAATGMPRLKVPAAIVTGKRSPSPFLHSARRIAKRHRMIHRMAEGSHMYPLEKPEMTMALCEELLSLLLQQEAA